MSERNRHHGWTPLHTWGGGAARAPPPGARGRGLERGVGRVHAIGQPQPIASRQNSTAGAVHAETAAGPRGRSEPPPPRGAHRWEGGCPAQRLLR